MRTETDSVRALETVKALSLSAFWAQPEVVINQTLYALMGDRKLAVEDGEITGVVMANG